MERRKLLLLTDWFYPGYKAGGPIQSCYNLTLLLRNRFDIYVVCSDRDLNETRPYPGIRSGEWSGELIKGIRSGVTIEHGPAEAADPAGTAQYHTPESFVFTPLCDTAIVVSIHRMV